jgi:hypothetical protein
VAAPRSGQQRDSQLVFVGGLHRSGTTMLANLLATHRMIAGLAQTGGPMDEGQHLQTVYPLDEHHGGPGRFAFDPAARLDADSPLATPANAAVLLAQWGRYWDADAPILLEKSPPNLIRFRFLHALFPAAKFILATRHPVPVTLSTAKWSPAVGIRDLLRHWVHAHDLAAADLAGLPHLVVRYEELTTDPETTMKAVADFLDVPVQFDLSGLDRVVNDRYFAQWRQRFATTDFADLAEGVARHGYRLADG